ncbi:MAG: hypothetical protein SFU98_13155 [Leptospiraceae bacterium]|nr:hypothetical protein [Leptospiraceae bacterium]
MPQAFFFPFSQCLQADQLLASPVFPTFFQKEKVVNNSIIDQYYRITNALD